MNDPTIEEIGKTPDSELSDFHVCWKYLYHSSADCIKDHARYAKAFVMADGYGGMSSEDLTEAELWYDWTHVRDSSDEAISEMATVLRA